MKNFLIMKPGIVCNVKINYNVIINILFYDKYQKMKKMFVKFDILNQIYAFCAKRCTQVFLSST